MIGVVGLGYVGKAVVNAIHDDTHVHIFDAASSKYKRFEDTSSHTIKTLDFLFVCLPTPSMSNGSVNISYLKSFFKHINKIKYEGTIIIKSTVTYDKLLPYLKYNVVVNPEFLNANTANEDFLNQKYIVLGGLLESCLKVKNLYNSSFTYIREKNIKFDMVSVENAINFKYMRNIKNALNVLYWNMVEDITYNSYEISKMLENIPTEELSDIYHNGYRGYGGACLSKDVQAQLQETEHPLLKLMEKYNKNIKRKGNKNVFSKTKKSNK